MTTQTSFPFSSEAAAIPSLVRRSSLRRWSPAAAVLLLCTAATAQVQWSPDPAVGLAVCDSTGDQDAVSACPDGSGGAFIVWQDDRGGDYDIYAQHLTADGVALWAEDGIVICDADGDQGAPQVISDGVGGILVAWGDSRLSGNSDIYLQRIESDGTVSDGWTEDGVAVCTVTGSSQDSPQLISDGAAGALVVWMDSRRGVFTPDLYALRMTSAGTVASGWTVNGEPICDATTGFRTQFQLASDAADGAFVTWTDNRSGNDDIYLSRILLSDGSPAPSWPDDGLEICTATLAQAFPQVVALAPGEALVAWEDRRNGSGDWNIYAQSLTTTGTVSAGWTADGIALCDATPSQARPKIMIDGTGGFYATWADLRGGSSEDIYASRFTAAGAPAAGWPDDGIAVCDFSGSQRNPAIATDGSGGAVLLWEDYRVSGANLYASKITSAGALATGFTTDGVAVATATQSQSSATIIPSVSGRTMFFWQDGRTASSGVSDDVYAAALYPEGALVPVALSSFTAE